jgi:hypothetical protein
MHNICEKCINNYKMKIIGKRLVRKPRCRGENNVELRFKDVFLEGVG